MALPNSIGDGVSKIPLFSKALPVKKYLETNARNEIMGSSCKSYVSNP
jgi:hypothetical protein